MRQVTDQMGRCVSVPEQPKRIISLVPSQTELLDDLGLREELIGLTKFCVHPKGLKKEKAIVGGTKDLKLDVIRSLKPDLIIGNKEENEREGIEALAEEFPVWMSDISCLSEALQMIERVGQLVNREQVSQTLATSINKAFDQLKDKKSEEVVYLIWHDPIMAAGYESFIDDMLRKCGYQNLIKENRYPTLSIDELKALKPDGLLLSSEPFPFKAKHIAFYQKHLPNTKIQLVDGEMFSWYGSRLLKAVEYFNTLA